MVRYVDLVQGEVFVAIVKGALIVAACQMVVFATPASAQGGGGGGFGFTFSSHNPYVGPKYSPDEDVGGCVWRRIRSAVRMSALGQKRTSHVRAGFKFPD
jgi:hypothetical protein